MAMTVRDILMDADAFRRAYPDWPHPEPEKGLPMTATPCWADPLTRDERRKVAEFLSRACGRFYRAALEANAGETARYARLSSSMDMSTLHLDVTERAELPPDHPVTVQARNRFADLSELAADENWLGI